MSKILIAECKLEVSTFNPKPTGYDDFTIRRGEEILAYHRAVRYEVSGAISILEAAADIQLVPAYSALLRTCGGALATSDWRRIADEFLAALRAAPAVDGVYFCMHGAMASDAEGDPEGYLLAEARKILGEEVPVVVSLDLHGILTDRMLLHSDALVAYHTYPHVDFFETGQRAARLLLRIMREGVRPVTAKVAIPALVRGDELITETGLFGQNIQIAQRYERSPGGQSAGMFIGNPFTDVPALQSYSFAVSDNDPAMAERVALANAELFWTNHERMQVPLVSLADLPALVLRQRGGTLGLVDAADATSSGASGDSNAVVRCLREAGYRGRLLAPLVDAPAVQRAFAAGVGAELDIFLGGTIDPARFRPLGLSVKVRLLADGHMISESFGGHWYAGPTAVLESENFTFVVSTRPVHLYDRTFFYAHGQDPRNFDAVVIKSPHCQHRMYEAWCARMINIDAPGSTSANLRSLGHTRCPRPIFPLDPVVPFTPAATFFQRPRYRR